jgi:hypothetical protein
MLKSKFFILDVNDCKVDINRTSENITRKI